MFSRIKLKYPAESPQCCICSLLWSALSLHVQWVFASVMAGDMVPANMTIQSQVALLTILDPSSVNYSSSVRDASTPILSCLLRIGSPSKGTKCHVQRHDLHESSP